MKLSIFISIIVGLNVALAGGNSCASFYRDRLRNVTFRLDSDNEVGSIRQIMDWFVSAARSENLVPTGVVPKITDGKSYAMMEQGYLSRAVGKTVGVLYVSLSKGEARVIYGELEKVGHYARDGVKYLLINDVLTGKSEEVNSGLVLQTYSTDTSFSVFPKGRYEGVIHGQKLSTTREAFHDDLAFAKKAVDDFMKNDGSNWVSVGASVDTVNGAGAKLKVVDFTQLSRESVDRREIIAIRASWENHVDVVIGTVVGKSFNSQMNDYVLSVITPYGERVDISSSDVIHGLYSIER